MNLLSIPPSVTSNINFKYCSLCYQHNDEMVIGTIARGPSSYCPKHYRIQSSRNKALSRGLYSPSLKELEAMIPSDMKCRLCSVAMVHTIREDTRNNIMSLQHWKGGTVEWICLRCNISHGACDMSDETWITCSKNLKENEKFCRLCKKVKDVSCFYYTTNGSKGRSSYCHPCHDEYVRNRKNKK